MSFDALCLPSLEGIAPRYVRRGAGWFVRPFTRTLLDAGLVTSADLDSALPRPPVATVLEAATYALERAWKEITAPLCLFDWNLRVGPHASAFEHDPPPGVIPDTVYAEIETANGPLSCRTVTLGAGALRLERVRAGLGQTALAALYDALRMLPLAAEPNFVFDIAEIMYWFGSTDEAEIVRQAVDYYGVESAEALREDTDFFPPAAFFASIPAWAARPVRTLTHRQCALAARRDPFARAVVAALDAVYAILWHGGPFARVGNDSCYDLIDFALIVRWNHDDIVMHILDDYARQCWESDYAENSACVMLNYRNGEFLTWLERMRNTARLARAVEYVLELLDQEQPGADGQAERPRVRV